MRRYVVVVAILVGALGASPALDLKSRKPITVRGEILDLSCYLEKGLSGAVHQDCAKMCLQSNVPMGLMTADSTLFLLTQDHGRAMAPTTYAGIPDMYAQCRRWAALQVEVNGIARMRNGVRVLEVSRAKLVTEPPATPAP